MHVCRRLIANPHLAALLCALTLFVRLLVPNGYMVGQDHGRVTIQICSGTQPRSIAMALPGMSAMHHGGQEDRGGEHDGRPDMPCAFAGLGVATLGAAGPVLLAAQIAHVMAAGLGPDAPFSPVARLWLRPPLRGPPARV
ncbi:hypothetical protein GCM10011380_13740 [Sphingomonas metalli]|uniref:DUF2946 domain-containing protein n=1 Tax=Sphingomonas metalli TaxID=1779358 RepID=A0A916T0G5_9SPHN|nr:DUF2946 family protein [Sphingomonas metalli]GGB25401.1 hypothetical protein GCM10011380_13740 [Sphingomonas metalli]